MRYTLLAILLALPAPATAGVKVQVGPPANDHHENMRSYDARAHQCHEMGGYMRHGRCHYSHRDHDRHGDEW